MKTISALLLTGFCAIVPAVVYASGGTCGSPSANMQDGSDTGNTCTDSGAANQVDAFCTGVQVVSNQPQEIYTVTLAAAGPDRTATQISVSSATSTGTFNPTLYLYTGTCANGGGCVQTGTASSPMDLTGVAAGTYLLAIGGSQLDASAATACGDFNITANGTLPVKLQSFSVQ
ncbi:MAG TPA: hypothetical protein VGH81_10840 [Rudaea sp.]|jgi:hypothetical protein